MSETNKQVLNTDNDDKDEEEDQFFDANDHFVDDSEQNKKKIKTETKANDEKKAETSGWFKTTLNWMSNTFSGYKPFEEEKRTKVEEMIISIKDETKRELQIEENRKTKADEDIAYEDSKALKLQIVSEKKDKESEIKKTEVTVINEDDIQIDSDDIEMSPLDSIKFLVDLILIFILDLFIISGTVHWIYNHLDGLDWYFETNTYFNFHIFFTTLGICSSGFGVLIHRIFRGWSSGALNFLHTTISLTSMIFLVIGIYAVFVSLNNMNWIHLYSVHSWLGLVSIVSIITLWLSGIIIFVFPRFVYDIQLVLIPVHSFFGRITFTLVCGTAIIGFSDKLRITDRDISLGPIGSDFKSNLSVSVPIKLRAGMTRITDYEWKMPDEAFLLNIISIVIFVYSLLVDYISSNNIFRRRLLPEEQGIKIITRIK